MVIENEKFLLFRICYNIYLTIRMCTEPIFLLTYYQPYYLLQVKLLSHQEKCTLSSIRRNSANFSFVLRLASENKRKFTLHQQETSALKVDFGFPRQTGEPGGIKRIYRSQQAQMYF